MSALPVDFALEYAARGWVVLPLKRERNEPHGDILGSGWTYETVGTSDPEVIRRWWTWDPAANIGIVLGARSGVIVLDVDRKKTDGWESLVAWQRERGWLPEGPVVRTPSGGGHLWFALPPGRDLRRKMSWLRGVDVCASGHQVAVPPSCRKIGTRSPKPWEPATLELREYEWTRTGPLPVAPEFLLEDVETRTPARRSEDEDDARGTGSGDHLPKTSDFLERGLGWFTGSRNQDCYRLAWRLWNAGRGDAHVTEVLTTCWEKTPQDGHPFPWYEVLKTAASARHAWVRQKDSEREAVLEVLRAWRRD